MCVAKFKEYLLEKSRVVYQNEYESTFHIFYLLFSGLNAEEKGKYHLKLHKKYRFMSNTTIDNCMTPENQEKFRGIRQSMNTIGFSQEVGGWLDFSSRLCQTNFKSIFFLLIIRRKTTGCREPAQDSGERAADRRDSVYSQKGKQQRRSSSQKHGSHQAW